MTKKPSPTPLKASAEGPKEPARKRSSRPSTTRSTAGPGFDFEDRVAAWLLLKALTGEQLPAIEGIAERLQMQTEALHWAIDDILLVTRVSQDDQRQLAISCKSNEQVTASALPADFVGRCWEQWNKPDPNPMQRGKDRLLLVTRQQNNAFMATWSDLKNAASGANDALAVGRMRATAKHRALFGSVKKPGVDAGMSISDGDVVAMIRMIDVVPVDFHIASSKDEANAVRQARSLLVSGNPTEAKRLWGELVLLASKTRLGGGTLDLSDVWETLRVAFVLKDHPDYAGSWTRLRALTREYRETVETSLPSGLVIDRRKQIDEAIATIGIESECVFFGDSGVGKSSLVKAMLDERFPNAEQVWFGPDTLEPALSEIARSGIGFSQPLLDILHATVRAENVLVIDAAERIGEICARKAKALIRALIGKQPPGEKPTWRVLIIGQTEAWASGTIQALASGATPKNVEVKSLADGPVRQVLRSIKELQWLATHDDAVLALGNLRTLAWVVQAAARFKDGGDGLSLTTIAERLWTHWTHNKPSVHRLLVRLATREASFEHSFAISTLDGSDVAVLDTLPDACPLRRDEVSGRIQFQHDLAADWARFQRLKEIASDTAQWAPLAGNPFWHPALRMLGQLLLRQPVGSRTAWDVAFEEAEKNREAVPLADDVLLDALFLDPDAETLLDRRADMLLANGGGRLLRLVNRFEHIATVPGVSSEMLDRFRDLSLYLEARMRMPIPGRWPAMARFLAKHQSRIAKMTSPAIARLCERWLTNMPTMFSDGVPIPYRKEFAAIALASARESQLIHAKGIPVLGDGEQQVYQAAFAGAPDLPAEVSEWALEMARRRPNRADIAEQVRTYRIEQATAHKARLENDPEYRKRHERLRRLPVSLGSSRERLPPWPLGAKGRIEGRFREAVLRSVEFQALMRVTPAVAGEVLLACIIEDEPEREYGNRGNMDHELGIEFDGDGYPTAPWKSPFYAFLQINAEAALGFLHQLIDFSTERWVQAVTGPEGPPPPAVALSYSDGEHSYFGNYWVFTWSNDDSNFIGQLHSALAALERWLCDLLDTARDVTAIVDGLLRTTTSVAVLGVLVNVGKHRPELFKGPLRPLLSSQKIYEWDFHRAQMNASGFNAMAWAQQGEAVFEMAKRWALAPYRQMKLRAVVPQMITSDHKLGEFILASSAQWTAPGTEKDALEFKMMIAELDHRNYTVSLDPATGQSAVRFSYPNDVTTAIVSFQSDNARALQAIQFPGQCRRVLTSAYQLNDQEAANVAALMSAISGAEDVDLPEDMKRAPLVACAVALLLRARAWLAEHADIAQEAQAVVDAALTEVADDRDGRGPHFLTAPSHLEFVGYYAFERWAAEPSVENDVRLLRVLTGGDDVAVRAIAWSGYANREQLGARWWRLLYIALLWSGLKMLAPRYDDDERAEIRWKKWRRWLRSRRLSDTHATASIINPLAIARRVERLEVILWQRRYENDGRRFVKGKGRRLSGSLETHFLGLMFGWLFRDSAEAVIPAQDLSTHRHLVSALWAHQAWWQVGSGEDDRDDYQPMQQLGYSLVDELARLSFESPVETTPALWRPVVALGPKGHYALGRFFTTWFAQLKETSDVGEFVKRWRPMIDAVVLNDAWAKTGLWFHAQQIERHALGFGATDSLNRPKNAAALLQAARDCYEAWSKQRLVSDEDNLAGFCGFLASPVGRPLRLDGLRWIAEAMKAQSDAAQWYRERTWNAFMAFLDVLVSDHADELGKNEAARQALLDLVAYAVSLQLNAAQTLQERIRRLF
ncbi:hypothetical protein [Bradyrhizobium sp. SZCCHNRI1058]|uniref:hypothetical protein n=1 Tax=Bradyrhizobium sp. SZCCHNRI1058 TaxID=3057279 RepID=UPI002916B357|nr:hypothetical protein [Bradyrhizobium sp. SZCCHNRI1058]